MDLQSSWVPIVVFILKVLFFFGGLYLFAAGIFDLLSGEYLFGIVSLIAGAAAVRIGAFLFSLKLK